MSHSTQQPSAAEGGDLIVLSAPSGAGKSTLVRSVFEHHPDIRERLAFSVSHATRPPRPGEVDGRDYHFVDEARFRALIEADGFLEWADVHGHLKGTSRAEVERLRASGRDVLLEIDVQGAAQVRRLDSTSISVFILPPSYGELERRLRGRGSDSAEQIARRLADARQELRGVCDYDYVIVNQDLSRAREALASVFRSRHHRRHRMQRDIDSILGSLD
ncbi:MAG: guanylate kinase [Acidobacteriota bacterium]